LFSHGSHVAAVFFCAQNGIELPMPFDRDHFEIPFTKLLKITKKQRALVDPERVHKLRTNTRRVEAIVGAVDVIPLDAKKKLLRRMKRVRRAAGVVRDMDVLTGKAAGVEVNGERNCQIQLLHYLGRQRERASRRLKKTIRREGKPVRSILRQGAFGARHIMRPNADHQQQPAARALEISRKLQGFATMNRRNLHEFRKEAKQLRYVLQIANPPDERLLDGLREMQDAIGEWHDWEELVGIAKDALSHGKGCGLIRELQLRADSSFDEALRLANRAKRELLGAKRGPAPLRIVKATEKIAA
jgi:CHAD domain-containing protein